MHIFIRILFNRENLWPLIIEKTRIRMVDFNFILFYRLSTIWKHQLIRQQRFYYICIFYWCSLIFNKPTTKRFYDSIKKIISIRYFRIANYNRPRPWTRGFKPTKPIVFMYAHCFGRFRLVSASDLTAVLSPFVQKVPSSNQTLVGRKSPLLRTRYDF